MNTRDGVEYEYEWTSDDGVNISHFYVSPDHRGSGRGSRVLQSLVADLRDAGATFIVVNMGGGDSAAEFLTSNGFEIVEQHHDHVTAEQEWSDN